MAGSLSRHCVVLVRWCASLAAVAAMGCTATGRESVHLPDGQLTQLAARQLSSSVSLDPGVWLRVDRVRVRPVPGTDLVRADLVGRSEDPATGHQKHHVWAMDARLQWRGQDCTLRLVQVELDVPPEERSGDVDARKRELGLAAALGRKLEGMALWTASDMPQTACDSARLRLSARAVEVRPGR